MTRSRKRCAGFSKKRLRGTLIDTILAALRERGMG